MAVVNGLVYPEATGQIAADLYSLASDAVQRFLSLQYLYLISNTNAPDCDTSYANFTFPDPNLLNGQGSKLGGWQAPQLLSGTQSAYAITAAPVVVSYAGGANGPPVTVTGVLITGGAGVRYGTARDPNAPVYMNSTVNQYSVTVTWYIQSATCP
jgi:hypothetical protein